MNCSCCGQANDPGSRFCVSCGAPIEASIVSGTPADGKPAMPVPPIPAYGAEGGSRGPRRKAGKASMAVILLGALCVLLAVALTLTLLGVTDAVFSPQPKGFETPEDAIEYFISHVKAGDYEGAMAACAVDEVAQNYDYEAMLKRIEAMIPSMPYLPAEYELYGAFNEASMKNQIMRQLAYMAFSVTLPEEYGGWLSGTPLYGDSVDFDDVVKDMDPEEFFAIEVVKIGEADLADNANNRDNMEKQAEIYGAADMVSRDVLYDADGDYYAGGVTLLEYDGGWLIFSLNDPLLSQSVYGALIPVANESEFDSLLGGSYVAPEVSESPESPAVTQTAPAEAPADSYVIGLSLPSMSSGWYAAQANDIAAMAAAAGGELYAFDANFDAATQLDQVENMIVMGVDAIAITPVNLEACITVLQEAKEAGIVVILLGRDETGVLNGLYVVSIDYDYYNDAKILAEWVETNMGGDLKIGEITAMDGIGITIDRSEGLHAVADANPGWEIVESTAANFMRDEAKTVAGNMLSTHPDIDVLFCQTDDLALGAADAVAEKGLTGQVTVVGIGGQAAALEAIQSGSIGAISTVDPHIGATLMDVADGVLSGQTVALQILVPSFIIDKANVDEMGSFGY
jgi:ABC-type sugar transport system substrate-binding protein